VACLTLHEKHRHIFTTVSANARTVDKAPPFMVTVAVVDLRLSNGHWSCASDSVSACILRSRWRAYNGSDLASKAEIVHSLDDDVDWEPEKDHVLYNFIGIEKRVFFTVAAIPA